MASSKSQVVFVLGGPGAGKGTQCGKIVEEYQFAHISAGDCLRAARNSGSADGDLINSYIKEGKIVPVEITVKLLKEAMEASAESNFLIDGFPRNEDNLQGWQRIVGDAADVRFVLFFDCPEEEMEARIMERGKTSGRVDDNADAIRKRFQTYMESTMPIINLFDGEGKVKKVHANRTIDEVFADVRAVLDEASFPKRA